MMRQKCCPLKKKRLDTNFIYLYMFTYLFFEWNLLQIFDHLFGWMVSMITLEWNIRFVSNLVQQSWKFWKNQTARKVHYFICLKFWIWWNYGSYSLIGLDFRLICQRSFFCYMWPIATQFLCCRVHILTWKRLYIKSDITMNSNSYNPNRFSSCLEDFILLNRMIKIQNNWINVF